VFARGEPSTNPTTIKAELISYNAFPTMTSALLPVIFYGANITRYITINISEAT